MHGVAPSRRGAVFHSYRPWSGQSRLGLANVLAACGRVGCSSKRTARRLHLFYSTKDRKPSRSGQGEPRILLKLWCLLVSTLEPQSRHTTSQFPTSTHVLPRFWLKLTESCMFLQALSLLLTLSARVAFIPVVGLLTSVLRCSGTWASTGLTCGGAAHVILSFGSMCLFALFLGLVLFRKTCHSSCACPRVASHTVWL
jgi:hypothetical protein